MTSFNLILGGVSCAFCGMEVSPSRAGGFHAPQTETHSLKIRLPASRSVAVLPTSGNVISGVSSLARVAWGRTVERSRTIFALRFVPVFPVNAGTSVRDLNFCRPHLAAGKPLAFFHRALRVCQDFAREWTKHLHLLQSAGTTGLVACVYGQHTSERKIGNVRKSSGEIRNVIR